MNDLFQTRITWGLAATVMAILILLGAVQSWAAPVVPAMAGSLVDRLVVVDPGHGGPDPGSIGSTGVLEKDVVLSVATKLRDFFKMAGTTTVLTRTEDVDLSGLTGGSLSVRKSRDIRARSELINGAGADVAVIVHANSTPSSRWRGAQTFYMTESAAPEQSRRLAESIQGELRQVLGNTRRMINNGIDQYLLEHATIPAVNVEIGFLSNPDEESLLVKDEYQRRVAWAIFLGVARYFAEGALPAAVQDYPVRRTCVSVWAVAPLSLSLESQQPNPIVSLIPTVMCAVPMH